MQMYPSLVTHLPEDGHNISRNMYGTLRYIYGHLSVLLPYLQPCLFEGLVGIST
jgi:hypothetical protein